MAQENYGRLGLPGDNLNLYAVLRVFQESPTLEEFEKRINSQEEMINNLDLNGDRKIDYIQVVDYPTRQTRHCNRVALRQKREPGCGIINVDRDRYDGVTIRLPRP